MTLEEELLKKGFKASGPFTVHNLGNALKLLFDKSPQPVYFKIIQGKIARDDMDNYLDLYMMYHITEEDLRRSPELFEDLY